MTTPLVRCVDDALEHSPLARTLHSYLVASGWRQQEAPWDVLPRYLPPAVSPGGARTLMTAVRVQILQEMHS